MYLLLLPLLPGCSNPLFSHLVGNKGYEHSFGVPAYSVSIDTPANGSIIAKSGLGKEGPEVLLMVSAAPGYMLTPNSLQYEDSEEELWKIDENTRTFRMPDSDVVVRSQFKQLPSPEIFSVSINLNADSHGIIIAQPEYGRKDTEITLTVIPDPGYRLKSGSLGYETLLHNGKPSIDGVTLIDEETIGFHLPENNVRVSAQFEELPGKAYSVYIGRFAGGRITTRPGYGTPGTEVVLAITPDPGYKLKPGSLHYQAQEETVHIDEESRVFIMPGNTVRVYAEFERLSPGYYAISVNNFPRGHILAKPEYAIGGTEITLMVVPDPGYDLEPQSLRYQDTLCSKQIDEKAFNFIMPERNVSIQADFVPLPPDRYSIAIGLHHHGTILAPVRNEQDGVPVRLTIIPDPGYTLKPGSLHYTDALTGEGFTLIDESTQSFPMPAFHARIRGEFEGTASGPYKVQIGTIEHGTITARPEYGIPGAEVQLLVSPDSGYTLVPNSLQCKNSTGEAVPVNEKTRIFTMPASHVRITAQFEAIPRKTHSVLISPAEHGFITADPEYGKAGRRIVLQVNPDPGYRLKDGSLTQGNTIMNEQSRMFLMPDHPAVVRAEFEKLPGGTDGE
jgi:hypothetical protein